MTNLFKKVACFTDIHLGLKHNAKTHNEDCVDYITWFIAEAQARNCETCICLGDFHHHRNTLNVSTLNYSIKVMKMLNDNFDQVFFIVGNHDNFYRANREINSLAFGTEFDKFTIVQDILIKDNVAIVPWLVDDEWKAIQKIKTKYMFGHFEIPGFKMNAHIEMPDHGGINTQHFANQDYVFSGHFHKRQQSGHVHYIGNPFGHNFSDAGDPNRGAMFLEWGGTPEYVNWENGPRYITTDLQALLENTDFYLTPKTYAKVVLNVDISYEEATFLKETFIESYNIRELKLVQDISINDDMEFLGEVSFQTIDQIVINQISNIESDVFNPDMLVEIYNNL